MISVLRAREFSDIDLRGFVTPDLIRGSAFPTSLSGTPDQVRGDEVGAGCNGKGEFA